MAHIGPQDMTQTLADRRGHLLQVQDDRITLGERNGPTATEKNRENELATIAALLIYRAVVVLR